MASARATLLATLAEYGSRTGFNGKLLVFPEPDRFCHVWQGILQIGNTNAFIFILRSARYLRPKFGYPLGDGLFWNLYRLICQQVRNRLG